MIQDRCGAPPTPLGFEQGGWVQAWEGRQGRGLGEQEESRVGGSG